MFGKNINHVLKNNLISKLKNKTNIEDLCEAL